MKIFHNPRCSKSRQTLALLEQNNINPEVILYLESPPSTQQLSKLCMQLSVEPTAIIRFKEDLCAELGIAANDSRTRAEWLQLISDNPKILERPIVSNGEKAAVGRPPENVLALL